MARPLQLDLLQLRNAQLSIMVWSEIRREKQVFLFVYLFVFHKWKNGLRRNPEEEQKEWKYPQKLWTRAVMTQVWDPGLGLQVGHWSCAFPFCLGSVLPFRKLRQWHLVTYVKFIGLGWRRSGLCSCHFHHWLSNLGPVTLLYPSLNS